MESSIRIDYDRSSRNVSQIKVSYRNSSNPGDEIDPRDKMVRDFLYPNGTENGLGKNYTVTDHTLFLDGISATIEPINDFHSEDLISNKKSTKRSIRDFFELDLKQDARIKAFDNTSKTKLEMEVDSLYEAIMRSFYISHTPEGAEYWQDVMIGEY